MAELKRDLGLLLNEAQFRLIKKAGKAGDAIEKHNHPEAKVLFTVVKGKIKVFINETETFEVEPGASLFFDGDNFINAELIEDSEVFITLINKVVQPDEKQQKVSFV